MTIKDLLIAFRSRSARRRGSTIPATRISRAAALAIEPLEHRLQLSTTADPNANNPFLFPTDECGVINATYSKPAASYSTDSASTMSSESEPDPETPPRSESKIIQNGGAYIGVGSFAVYANNQPPPTGMPTLHAGATYEVQVTSPPSNSWSPLIIKPYDPADPQTPMFADAEYSFRPGESGYDYDASSDDSFNDTDVRLRLGGIMESDPKWGAYSEYHTYSVNVTGTGDHLSGSFIDDDPSDNTGMLSVSVAKVVPYVSIR